MKIGFLAGYTEEIVEFAARAGFGSLIYHVHAKDTEIRRDKLSHLSIYGGGWWRYRIPGWGEQLKSEVQTDSAAPASSNYVRVWRKSASGVWQVAIDIAIPVGRP